MPYNLKIKIATLIGTLTILVLLSLTNAILVFAHGGGGEVVELPSSTITNETVETTVDSGSSTLPFIMGGSAVVIVALVGLSLWQRHKNS